MRPDTGVIIRVSGTAVMVSVFIGMVASLKISGFALFYGLASGTLWTIWILMTGTFLWGKCNDVRSIVEEGTISLVLPIFVTLIIFLLTIGSFMWYLCKGWDRIIKLTD